MTYPLIFTHYGKSSYLNFTLKQARRTNINRRLIILGDRDNYDLAINSGWEHYDYTKYTSSLHQRFDKSFIPIFGPANRPRFAESPEAEASFLRWLRFVAERWFFIDAFINEQKIERFWHFDSDTMILKDLICAESDLANFDYTSQCNNACLNGLITSEVAKEFITHICELYEDSRFVAAQQAQLDASGSDHAFTEMSAFRSFKETSSRRGAWLMNLGGRYVFDDCLCQDHGFETTTLPFGRPVKRIKFAGTVAIGRKDGEPIEFVTLNLSWLPLYSYEWVCDAQAGVASPDIQHLRGDSNFARVGYRVNDSCRTLLPNAYDMVGDIILSNYKATYRATRKKLVTFSANLGNYKTHRSIASRAIQTCAFDAIDHWNLDALKKRPLFLRRSNVS